MLGSNVQKNRIFVSGVQIFLRNRVDCFTLFVFCDYLPTTIWVKIVCLASVSGVSRLVFQDGTIQHQCFFSRTPTFSQSLSLRDSRGVSRELLFLFFGLFISWASRSVSNQDLTTQSARSQEDSSFFPVRISCSGLRTESISNGDSKKKNY